MIGGVGHHHMRTVLRGLGIRTIGSPCSRVLGLKKKMGKVNSVSIPSFFTRVASASSQPDHTRTNSNPYKQQQSLRTGLQHHCAVSTSSSPLHQWPGHEGLPTGDVEQVCWGGLAEACWSAFIEPDYF